jgi:hypothetical protein
MLCAAAASKSSLHSEVVLEHCCLHYNALVQYCNALHCCVDSGMCSVGAVN